MAVKAATTTSTIESRLRRGCILVFFLYMSHGVVGPFLPLIWSGKGYTDHEVGVLGSIRPAVSFLAVPAICALGDLSGRHQRVLYALLVLYGFSRPLVLAAGSVFGLAALEVMASLSEAPANSLVDSGARYSFGTSGYGRMRMWGGLGFGVASLIGGLAFDAGTEGYDGMMVIFVCLTGLTMLAATGVPLGRNAIPFEEFDETSDEKHRDPSDGGTVSTPDLELTERGGEGKFRDPASTFFNTVGGAPTEDSVAGSQEFGVFVGATSVSTTSTDRASTTDRYHTSQPAGRVPAEDGISGTGDAGSLDISRGSDEELGLAESGEGESALSTVWRALRTVDAVSFSLTVVLSGMGSGFIDTFLFIRLQELGGSHTLFGLARLIMCLAEVPCFYISGSILRRLGPRGVAGLAQIGFLTRFLYYAVLRDPWWVLPAELLHGLTFATMWAATIEYASRIAPVGSEATMVGVLSGLHQGLGVALGALVGGYAYAGLGPSRCFREFAALPIISLAMLALPAVLRSCHIGGGNRRKEDMINEQGLQGWGGAVSRDFVMDANPVGVNGRQDEAIDDNSTKSDAGKGDSRVGEKGARGTATEFLFVGVTTE